MSAATRAPPILIAVAFVATALSGCLQAQTSGEATISRVYTVLMDPEVMERVEEIGEDDPERALRELLDTSLVVRVTAAGDYTLEYTDESGATRTQTFAGMTPGTPMTVTGADPLAPAILKEGDTTRALRAGVNGAWWHIGDFPLGFNSSAGAKAVYDWRATGEESITLANLKIDQEETNVRVDNLAFRLNFPLEGTASWTHTNDAADGWPVLIAGEMRIPASAGDLATLEISATMNGEAGTAGIIAGVDDAIVSGSMKLWAESGQPSAAQFMGGRAKAAPRVTMWADGFFGGLAEGQSCAGTSKADRCSPEEIEPLDETFEAGEKDTADPSEFPRATSDEEREALTLLQRIFSLDIVPGDALRVTLRADSSQLTGGAPDAPKGNFATEFSLEAVGIEDVTVPAGTFSAIKLVEETRTSGRLLDLNGPDGEPIVREFSMAETIARTTFWLDTKTYVPVKMVAETPLDMDGLLKRMIDAIEPSAWEPLGGKPVQNSDWRIVAKGTSSYQLREHSPGVHVSAPVGLGLAHSLTGAFMVGPLAYITGSGFGTSPAHTGITFEQPYDEYRYGEYPYDPESRPRPVPLEQPPARLALSSAGPLENGVKTYEVVAASDALGWLRLGFEIDGNYLYLDTESPCGTATTWSFTACRGGASLTYQDFIEAGDRVSFAAEAGQTLVITDEYTSSVLMTLTIG